jgi:hypothetical protein
MVGSISRAAFTGFIVLHAPDGLRITVNHEEISTLRDPRGGHFAPGVHCVLVMTNRSFIGVVETCDDVRHLLPGEAPCAYVCGGTR